MNDTIRQLEKAEINAQIELGKAEIKAHDAHKELGKARQQEKVEGKKETFAHLAKDAIANTSLPEWIVNWIQYEAYENGHSAGQSEVDMLTHSMIRTAERFCS